MAQTSRQAAKGAYNKPQLKRRIDEAMAAFQGAGKTVEHVPAMVITEPPSAADAQALGERAREEAAAKKNGRPPKK